MSFQIEFDRADEVTAFIRARIRHFFPNGSEVDVIVPSRSPLLDEELTGQMVEAALATGHAFEPVDAIPGTFPLRVGTGEPRPFFSTMQHRYCTNLDVMRPNRRRIFARLVERFPDLHEWRLKKILAFLESDEGIDFVVAYGEPVELERHHACPHCGSGLVQPLYSTTSHPITGFLTKSGSVYSYCLSCALAFMNRQMKREDLWRYYSGDIYANAANDREIEDLYADLSESNTSHYSNYLAVKRYVEQAGAIVDLGAGRGEFAVLARQWSPHAAIRAVDWRFDDVVAKALVRRGIEAVSGELQSAVEETSAYDLVTTWEVLEHIKLNELPHFLRSIHRALKPGGAFVFSTPDLENPFAHALDFWAMAPGEHISILSRRFLEPVLRSVGFEIEAEMHESVTVKLPDAWFAFGEATDVSMSSKAASKMINLFLRDHEARERFRQRARDENLGSELILVCRKMQ